jgi:hypothetical protein
MGRVKRQWHAGLLLVLMAVHVGCAARGRADSPRDPAGAPPVEVVSVAAGDGRVRSRVTASPRRGRKRWRAACAT